MGKKERELFSKHMLGILHMGFTGSENKKEESMEPKKQDGKTGFDYASPFHKLPEQQVNWHEEHQRFDQINRVLDYCNENNFSPDQLISEHRYWRKMVSEQMAEAWKEIDKK